MALKDEFAGVLADEKEPLKRGALRPLTLTALVVAVAVGVLAQLPVGSTVSTVSAVGDASAAGDDSVSGVDGNRDDSSSTSMGEPATDPASTSSTAGDTTTLTSLDTPPTSEETSEPTGPVSTPLPSSTSPESSSTASPASSAPTAVTTSTTVATTTTTEGPVSTAPPEPDAVVMLSITEPPVEVEWPVRPIVFPVVGPVGYVDTWGAYRASIPSKFHVGVDLIGVRLQPLVAAVSGTITRYVVDHPTAGWGIVLTGDDGWQYRYYHVNNDAPGTDDGTSPAQWRFRIGLREGDRVKAGELIGYMGDSGDSETSVPHLHFEIRTPEGSPINPYPSVRAAAKTTRCSPPEGFGASDLPLPVDTDAIVASVRAFAGEGGYLVSSNGTSFPYGSGRVVGSPAHIALDGPCDEEKEQP